MPDLTSLAELEYITWKVITTYIVNKLKQNALSCTKLNRSRRAHEINFKSQQVAPSTPLQFTTSPSPTTTFCSWRHHHQPVVFFKKKSTMDGPGVPSTTTLGPPHSAGSGSILPLCLLGGRRTTKKCSVQGFLHVEIYRVVTVIM